MKHVIYEDDINDGDPEWEIDFFDYPTAENPTGKSVWKRLEKFSPFKAMKQLGVYPQDVPYIEYCPELDKLNYEDIDYRVLRGMKHDGCLAGTVRLYKDALLNLINRCSYSLKQGLPPEGKAINYKLGSIYMALCYCNIKLPEIVYPIAGNYERISMRVLCEYVDKEDK